MKHTAWAAVAWLFAMPPMFAQVHSFPHLQSFDAATTLPSGWETSGFTISSTSSRSSPRCLSATGNNGYRWVLTPPIRFGGRTPDRVTFYERRTTTALRYRLSISVITEDSMFVLPLANWDSAETANNYTLRTVLLGSTTLPSDRDIRFLFRILPDSTNSTGVLRIDDVVIDARVSLDVLPLNVVLNPLPVTAGQPIKAELTLINIGFDAAGTGLATARWTSSDRPGMLPVVRFAIAGQETLRLNFVFHDLPPGPIDLTFVVNVEADEDVANDTLTTSFTVGYAVGSVVINEIMYAPIRPDEPEWIELFNPGPWAIGLQSLTVSDNSTSRVPLASTANDSLMPGEFIVLSRSADLSPLYPPFRFVLVPFPSLNNTTPDAVVIRNAGGSTIDSMTYAPSTGDAPGQSLERRDHDLPSLSPRNWRASIDPLRATPGSVNSVQRRTIDVAAGSLHLDEDPMDPSRALLTASVYNLGRMPVARATVSWRRTDGLLTVFEELGATTISDLRPEDSARVGIPWTGAPPGPSHMMAIVHTDGDLDPVNDTAFVRVLSAYRSRQLVINEIMFEPEVGWNEWAELYNAGDEPIDIGGWTIEDLPTATGSVVRLALPPTSIAVPPSSFVLLAADSSVMSQYPSLEGGSVPVVVLARASGFGLNNGSDGLIVRDRTGTVIDSVTYAREWHVTGVKTAGRSLERTSVQASGVDRASWTSSAAAAGATPGRENSVSRRVERNALEVALAPDPFSPDGDGFEDRLLIVYRVKASSLFLHVRIFDLLGREMVSLSSGQFVPSEGTVEWDGRSSTGRVVPIGGYVVLVQATNAVSGASYSAKRVAVVAR